MSVVMIEAFNDGWFGDLRVEQVESGLMLWGPHDDAAWITSPAVAVSLASALLQWATQNREELG